MDEPKFGEEPMLLLLGLYAHEDLLKHAIRVVGEYEIFDELKSPGYRLLWITLRDSYVEFQERPSPAILLNRTTQDLSKVSYLSRDLAVKQIQLCIPLLHPNTQLECKEAVQRHLKNALAACIRHEMTQIPKKPKNPEDLAKELAGMSETLSAEVTKKSVRKRPLERENRAKVLRFKPRRHWGIDYWDKSGMDWDEREMHGLLGPTGGGKTVNAVNIAVRQLRERRNVVLALYEQALEEDVAQRIFANLANISMKHLRGKNYDEIDPKIHEKLDKVGEEYSQYLMVYDMVGEDAGQNGPDELFAYLDEEREETGWYPDLIIIDWLGEMVTRFMGSPLHNGRDDFRRVCENFMSKFNQYKENPRNATTFLILHQTSTEANSFSPSKKPQRTDSYDFKAFANKCDTCSILGTMEAHTNLCWFIPGKSRRSAKVDRIVQLNGEYMRFIDVTDDYRVNPVGHGFISTSVEGTDQNAPPPGEVEDNLYA